MIIIGEKINGAIPSVADAIRQRDAKFIRSLAIKQTESGADYLDVCAGTSPDIELQTLQWLVSIVQETTDIPICIDSPDPDTLIKILPEIDKAGIINSVSGEGDKCQVLYSAIAHTEWQIIALTCDDSGIPSEASRKIKIAERLIETAAEYGISPDRIYIDPLVLSLSAVNDALLSFTEAVHSIKRKYPAVKFTSGLSNISYGMPCRKRINQNFLTLALAAGMDSAIMDPTNKEMYSTILATEALLGRDKYCLRYNKAYRSGYIL